MRETAGGGHLPLEVRIDREGESVLIGLLGELTLAAQQTFEEALRELEKEPVKDLVIDLAGVTFADSTGLLLLITTWKRCCAEGTAVAFEGASEQMQQLLEGTGVNNVLPIVPSGATTDTSHRAPQPGAEWAGGTRPKVPTPPGTPPHFAPDIRNR